MAVNLDATHRFSKAPVDQIRLIDGLGVEGDAHAGATVQHLSRVRRDPTQPNLRQVHLIHIELLEALQDKGFDVQPGQLGENVTTCDVDLLALPVGSTLTLGGTATVTVTGLRNPCLQIEAFAPGLLREVVHRDGDGALERLAGVMAVVSRAGVVRPGDAIAVDLPAEPHRPLEPV